ncbi:MAG: flagellar hook-length control protein FliK, partial [Phycisphaerales bacterium]|nr:flagellar hook-length control protein FliK [Phycisphaerales bacterium]
SIARVGGIAPGGQGTSQGGPTGAPVAPTTGAADRKATVEKAPPQPRTFRALRDEVAHQASKALGAALKQQGGKVTMRLAPDTLGSLRVEMHLSKAEVSVRFSADQVQARELLGASLDALRATLESHGLRVARMEVRKGKGDREAEPTPGREWKRHRLAVDAIV